MRKEPLENSHPSTPTESRKGSAPPHRCPKVSNPDDSNPEDTFIPDLLGVSLRAFLSDVHEKTVHGPYKAARRFAIPDMAAMADIDYMLTHVGVLPSDVQLIVDGRTVKNDRRLFTRANFPKVEYFYERFLKGATIRIVGVHKYLPRVASLADALASALAMNVGANLYLTPETHTGLHVHFDTHDVLVCQCAGTKRWRLYRDYAGTRALPAEAIMDYDYVRHVPGEVSRDILMEPGDVLYVPRGTMHDACTEHGDSLHLTFSLLALTVGDLMMRTAKLAMEEDPTLRAAMAYDVRAHPAAVDDATVERMVRALTTDRRLDRALEAYRGECRERRGTAAHHLFAGHDDRREGTERLRHLIADRIRQLRARQVEGRP